MTQLITPASVVTCLGIDISTTDLTFSIPRDKLALIKDICRQWSFKSRSSRRQMQSLLGKLLYVSKCVRYARIFMGRMLKTFRSQYNQAVIYLDRDFHLDLNWFNVFLQAFNGCVFFERKETYTVYVDASFLGGWCHF